ncbi:hypothetical protein [Clostridium sp. 'White wine YQ']|uniref:hypothetical protein n=1 Tax=Clostridium sp. 'White wine YQ' TaxID=3027474 RepID=UPI002366382F|nr:hypothetical protein [Clostridium sp. 'White wine YQ']MDD7794235.1 hypothetical protein [Clostridium sp. 'White wine YQ']
MNWPGMLLIALGVIYLIYSLLNKSKINYYFKRYIKRKEMEIIKPKEYFKLQLIFSVFNALVFIVSGVIMSIFTPNNIFFIVALVPFDFINLWLMIESKKHGYIDYNAYKTYKS